jgi:hypothetical protein
VRALLTTAAATISRQDSELRIFSPSKEAVVVESCSGLSFRSWDAAYPQLDAQFVLAEWTEAGGGTVPNQWASIYNFTPPAEGAPPSYTKMETAAQAEHRWCELAVEAEGLCGGRVTETRGAAPSVEGCECPAVSADGTVYSAAWYAGRGAAPEPTWATDGQVGDSQSLEAGQAAAVSPADVSIDVGGGGGGGGAVVEQKSWLHRMYALMLWLFGAAPKQSQTSTKEAPAPAGGGSADATAVCAVQ